MSSQNTLEEKSKAKRKEYLCKRFMTHGAEGLSSMDALELLLGYCYSEPEIFVIMDRLLARYGDVLNVFNASCQDLKNVAGMTDSAIALIGMLSTVNRKIQLSRDEGALLNDAEDACRYFMEQFRGVTNELFKIVVLGDDYSVKKCVTVASGSVFGVEITPQTVIKSILNTGCRLCILAHNHPGGSCMPSKTDIASTKDIINSLRKVDVVVVDHIIVGRDGALSMNDYEKRIVPWALLRQSASDKK